MAPLLERADMIIERWKQEMQRLPLPVHVHVIEEEAGERVSRIASAVIAVLGDEEAAERFAVGGDAYTEAAELGRLRHRQGFSIEELVQEHVILRNEFWNLFHEQVHMKQAVDFHLEKRMNRCFDLMLQAAASSYQFERSREMMENPLRDTETGLYNKSYFHGRMIEELRRSVRYVHDITLVLFEITDCFEVREREGDQRTVEMLRNIAVSLGRMTRECDVVARMGEGSFAVLLPETGWRGGQVMAERLSRYFLNEPSLKWAAGEDLRLCWGLASYPEEVGFPERLYASAVEAMRSSRDLAAGEVAIYRGSEKREGG